MTLSIVTGVCGALEITIQWLAETVGRCETWPEVVVVENGGSSAERVGLAEAMMTLTGRGTVIANQQPLGSTRAFNQGIAAATGDVVALLHNDLMVREVGWDQIVLNWFEQHPETGAAGFHGSRELGHPLLYRIPYELHQLARGDNWSNLEDAEAHGSRTNLPLEVVTLDGMGLIARRQDLEDWGGLDERYPHHQYDHDLALTARQHGRHNYVLPISARHISGQTANHSRWNEHLRALGLEGGDGDVHRQAHLDFWLKWRGTGMLPARV